MDQQEKLRATTLLMAVAVGLAAACTPSTAPTASTSPAASGPKAATPLPGAQGGIITGPIQFPADFIPPLAIYAISTDGSSYYVVETVQNQDHYMILGVSTGDYYVYAATRRVQVTGASSARTQSPLRFGGGYTKSVQCGLSVSCTDHSMIPVHAGLGANAINIDPADWYVGPDFYPLIPGPPPRVLTLPAAGSAYANPQGAAEYYAQLATGGQIVLTDQCPVNVACARLGSEHDGDSAAYFPYTAGSNQDVQACAVYLFHDSSGWHQLDTRCRHFGGGDAFPSVQSNGFLSLGRGETGCINIHGAPSLSAPVVACLPGATPVTIDNGPRYVQESVGTDPSVNYWWHVLDRGWVVHRFVGA